MKHKDLNCINFNNRDLCKYDDIKIIDNLTISKGSAKILDSFNSLKEAKTITIEDMNDLIEISGFKNLESLDSLVISNNHNLRDINGFSKLFEKSFKINGTIKIIHNKVLTNIKFLYGLRSVEKSLYLHYNNLKSLSGLKLLEHVGASFSLASNSLTTIKLLSNLKSVHGSLSLVNNNLTTLEGLENLSKLKTSKWNGKYRTLAIFSNKKLNDIKSLSNIKVDKDELIILTDKSSNFTSKPNEESTFAQHNIQVLDSTGKTSINRDVVCHVKDWSIFKELAQCSIGTNCDICRNIKYGRAWRENFYNVLATPPGGIDFNCPFGKEWSRYGYIIEDQNSINKKYFNITEQSNFCKLHISKDSFPTEQWGKTIDIIYPYFAGEQDTSEELKYSIRSLKNIHENINVWIVGDKPSWLNLKTAHYIYHEKSNKVIYGYADRFTDMKQKIYLALNRKDMGSHFIYMNDDLYILKPILTAFLGIPRYFIDYTNNYTQFNGTNQHAIIQHNGFNKLKEFNSKIRDYSLHWPYVHKKESYLELHKRLKMDKVPYNHESIYFSLYSDIAVAYAGELLRIDKTMKRELLDTDIPDKVFVLNNKTNSFKKISKFLKELFNEKSIYEN